MTLKGIQYVVDEKGAKTGVFIDLKKNHLLWEDFLDAFVSRLRKKESRVSLDTVKSHLGIKTHKSA
jgi:hypothetical protein